MDKADLIELAECQLADWAKRCHNSGLDYKTIYWIVENNLPKTKMMAEAEKYIKEGKKG